MTSVLCLTAKLCIFVQHFDVANQDVCCNEVCCRIRPTCAKFECIQLLFVLARIIDMPHVSFVLEWRELRGISD